jgi:hypothetical protein
VRTTAEAAGDNCATGGTKVEAGTDANRDGDLDDDEVIAAATRYVCNGAEGPRGPQGIQGIQGEQGVTGQQGPQGVAGATGIYGDGSAGALTVNSPLDLTTSSGYNLLSSRGQQTLQFTNVTINSLLIVPSGTVIRATGDFTVNTTGTIIVAPSVEDNGPGEASAGVARSAAGEPRGGRGLYPLQASQLFRPGVHGGGSGAKQNGVQFGAGGGSLVIAAQGTFRVIAGGAINAIGDTGGGGPNPGNLPGSGGGGGGVVVIVGKQAITINGAVRAVGGRGGDGNNNVASGPGKGGGGGGGGGVIHLLSSTAPVVNGTVDVSPGAAGALAAATGGNPNIIPGGGGGACGGNGGDGGAGTSAAPVAATAGSVGFDFRTTTPTPENLLL